MAFLDSRQYETSNNNVSLCSLKGVPLAYDNIRILGPQGNIHDDSGYIHLDVEASFVVFKPQKGKKVLVISSATPFIPVWHDSGQFNLLNRQRLKTDFTFPLCSLSL